MGRGGMASAVVVDFEWLKPMVNHELGVSQNRGGYP